MSAARLPGMSFAFLLMLFGYGSFAAEPPPAAFTPPAMPSQVFDAINSWLWLCRNVGAEPGTRTNLESVDWEHSFSYTNAAWSQTIGGVQVRFSNGVKFEAFGTFAISHYAADAAFVANWESRSLAERERFDGTVNKDWRELTRALTHRLVVDVGIPAELLAQFNARPQWFSAPEVGSYACKRLVVVWRRNGLPLLVGGRAPAPALTVEFDLGTGALKSISFGAPEMINALAKRQKEKP